MGLLIRLRERYFFTFYSRGIGNSLTCVIVSVILNCQKLCSGLGFENVKNKGDIISGG